MKRVALWGPSSSGKTVWLAQLYLRFDSLNNDWLVFPTSETQRFVDRMRERIDDKLLFPVGTEVGKAETSIAYEFEHPPSKRRVTLFTEDEAGSRSVRLEQEDKARFAAAHGLVMLIDIRRPKCLSEIARTLELFFHDARTAGMDRDQRPLAVCLAQADHLIQNVTDFRSAVDTPQEFACHWLGPEIIKLVDRFCPSPEHRRFYPVSSLGVEVKFGTVRPAVFLDEAGRLRPTRMGTPIHLFTPFQWLFTQLS